MVKISFAGELSELEGTSELSFSAEETRPELRNSLKERRGGRAVFKIREKGRKNRVKGDGETGSQA